jgi:hypothetical protein
MMHIPQSRFRVGTAIFAVALGAAAIWLLLVQIFRPALPFFPEDAATAEAIASHRGSAGLAARIGFFRGNLWSDYALTLEPVLRGLTGPDGAPLIALLDDTRSAATRAVRLAPFDARAWLLIAAVNSQAIDRDPTGALKMSFYAAPNELSLIPLRIRIATRSNAIADPEIQTLLGAEIQNIVTRAPALKTQIIAAYRNALPEGRLFIETQVGQVDPSLLVSLRAGPSQ